MRSGSLQRMVRRSFGLATALARGCEAVRESNSRARLCGECAKDEPSDDGAPTSRELVEQALLDGECCVFYTWPIDAPDANDQNA